MNSKLPSITISGLALSDLFFNSTLENYNAVDRSPDNVNCEAELKSALAADAVEFCEMIGVKGCELPHDLMNDFLARI